jgi:hypothetical protein
VKEQLRASLAGASLHALFQDAQYAWRGLRRRPAFTFITLTPPGRQADQTRISENGNSSLRLYRHRLL